MNQSPLHDWGQVGPDASPELVAATSVIALAGGLSGSPLEGKDDVFDAASQIYDGMNAEDDARVETGVKQLEGLCEDKSLNADSNDTTDEGMFSYACALADDVADDNQDLQGVIALDEGGSAELMNKAMGAAALLGGMAAWEMPGHGELSMAANGLYAGLNRADVELASENLELITELCQTD